MGGIRENLCENRGSNGYNRKSRKTAFPKPRFCGFSRVTFSRWPGQFRDFRARSSSDISESNKKKFDPIRWSFEVIVFCDKNAMSVFSVFCIVFRMTSSDVFMCGVVLNFGLSLAEMLGQHFCRVGFFVRWGLQAEKLEKPLKNTKF